jgi:CRP/FNR family cyclic AMP-dependent transcriptional regulator
MAGSATKSKPKAKSDPKLFLAEAGEGRTLAKYRENQPIFLQGEPADSIFHIQKAKSSSPLSPNRARRR